MAITEKFVSSAGAGAHDGSSEANAFSWAEMVTDINAGGKAGNRYNVKGSISRTTTTDTLTGDGTSTSPVIIRGYGTTIGDGFQGRSGGNGALVTANMPDITYTTGRLTATGSDWVIYESLQISGASTTNTLATGSNCAVKSCVLTHTGTGANAVALSAGASNVVFDNDLTLSGGSGGTAALSAGGVDVRVVANRINGGPAAGVTSAGVRVIVIDNLIFASGGIGVTIIGTGTPCVVYGNTIVGGGSDGVDVITGTTVLQFVANCMITDNSGNGVDGVSAANAIFAAYNRTRDNAAAYNSATDWLAATRYGDVTTDTGGPETDYADGGSDDYSLIGTSPAKGAGWWPYRDIGALQRQEYGARARSIVGV